MVDYLHPCHSCERAGWNSWLRPQAFPAAEGVWGVSQKTEDTTCLYLSNFDINLKNLDSKKNKLRKLLRKLQSHSSEYTFNAFLKSEKIPFDLTKNSWW